MTFFVVVSLQYGKEYFSGLQMYNPWIATYPTRACSVLEGLPRITVWIFQDALRVELSVISAVT